MAHGNVYAGSDDGYLYALDASTGQRKWRYKTGGPVRSSPAPTAVNYNYLVYAGSDDGTLYAIDYRYGTLGWRFPPAAR